MEKDFYINIDKCLNDLLSILETLDGRVRKLEIKTQIKKSPSYLKVVVPLKERQVLSSIEQMTQIASELGERIQKLEK
jgi:hypothetical protein